MNNENENENENGNRNDIMRKVKNYWNRQPCNIRHSTKELYSKEYFEEVRMKKMFVESHIPDFINFEKYRDKNVLEVGCGIGTFAHYFMKSDVKNFVGLDLSDVSIDATRRHILSSLNDKKDKNDKNVDIFEWNIEEKLPEKYTNYFDFVCSFGVLHHTSNIDLALQNIYATLKEGGEFKLMLYAKNSWKFFMIKGGLDQYEAQNNCPIANVYTNDEVVQLLSKHNFKNIDIKQTHIFKYNVEKYKQGIYEEEEWFKHMSDEMKKILEENLGWHLCITCYK